MMCQKSLRFVCDSKLFIQEHIVYANLTLFIAIFASSVIPQLAAVAIQFQMMLRCREKQVDLFMYLVKFENRSCL